MQILDNGVWISVFVVMIAILNLRQYVCHLLVQKEVTFFPKERAFRSEVISIYKSIGKILIIFGMGFAALSFIVRVVLTSEIKLDLGISPHLILIVSGLFFVLSETFLGAKITKEQS